MKILIKFISTFLFLFSNQVNATPPVIRIEIQLNPADDLHEEYLDLLENGTGFTRTNQSIHISLIDSNESSDVDESTASALAHEILAAWKKATVDLSPESFIEFNEIKKYQTGRKFTVLLEPEGWDKRKARKWHTSDFDPLNLFLENLKEIENKQGNTAKLFTRFFKVDEFPHATLGTVPVDLHQRNTPEYQKMSGILNYLNTRIKEEKIKYGISNLHIEVQQGQNRWDKNYSTMYDINESKKIKQSPGTLSTQKSKPKPFIEVQMEKILEQRQAQLKIQQPQPSTTQDCESETGLPITSKIPELIEDVEKIQANEENPWQEVKKPTKKTVKVTSSIPNPVSSTLPKKNPKSGKK